MTPARNGTTYRRDAEEMGMAQRDARGTATGGTGRCNHYGAFDDYSADVDAETVARIRASSSEDFDDTSKWEVVETTGKVIFA